MAEIANNAPGKAKGRRGAKRIHMDMTPMVDLAFLLLTFFVLSATFSKPTSMEMVLPPDDGKYVKIKNGITFLVSENRLFYYEGEFKPKLTKLLPTNKDAIKSYLSGKYKTFNKALQTAEIQFKNQPDSLLVKKLQDIKRSKDNPTILVKADNKASYQDVIDVIDEVNHQPAGKYAIVDLNQQEYDLMKPLMLK